MERLKLIHRIANVTESTFTSLALDVFRYQAAHNHLYAQYLSLLGLEVNSVQKLTEIPFLPIQLFKQHEIKTGEWTPEVVFTSSGTTGTVTSRHLLRDTNFYRTQARKGFSYFYGPLDQYVVLALLPSYLERTGSSLVFMADDFIQQALPLSGFFLHNTDELLQVIQQVRLQNNKLPTNLQKRILLLGVSFALWDLAEQASFALEEVIIMETGGMKGRRQEITRPELHQILQRAFKTSAIHSEYGMTELLSQAYSKGNGIFHPTPTMRVFWRETTDPLKVAASGKNGAINIIDLANIDTISFIATEDVGNVYPNGSFEISGRLDIGDIRGCNLMVI
ncbi:MAG: acyl transferase [Saprospiraceae bacterium]